MHHASLYACIEIFLCPLPTENREFLYSESKRSDPMLDPFEMYSQKLLTSSQTNKIY